MSLASSLALLGEQKQSRQTAKGMEGDSPTQAKRGVTTRNKRKFKTIGRQTPTTGKLTRNVTEKETMHQHAQTVFSEPTAPVIDNWRALMNAVIQQAVDDLTSRDPQRATGAALFFLGDNFPWFAEAVGRPDRDGVQFLTSGQARAAQKILRRRNGRRNRLSIPV